MKEKEREREGVVKRREGESFGRRGVGWGRGWGEVRE